MTNNQTLIGNAHDGLEPELKHKIVALIAALMPHVDIYLYGSRARGSFGKYSDIDIALDAGAGKRIPFYEVAEMHDVVEALRMPYKVDVVDLWSMSDSMREFVIQERVLWKKKIS